ncbi:MAG: LamG-like jellyroll fold domain-containing protein [Cyanobacteria bacterium P01_D01_bin.156]
MSDPKALTHIEALEMFKEHHPDLNSIEKILEFTEAIFIETFKGQAPFNGDIRKARKTYRSAQRVQEQITLLWANIKDTIGSPSIKNALFNNIPDTFFQHQNLIPAYNKIFDNLDYTETDHSRSIFGPAAYFVDLMRFIEKNITKQSPNIPEDHKLETRQPRLFNIPLGKENTFDLVPYIDLVNETLEDVIREKDKTPYEILEAAKFPMHLPFHLPLEEVRLYLEQLKLSLEEIYRLFSIVGPLSFQGLEDTDIDEDDSQEIYKDLQNNHILDFRGALTAKFQPDNPTFSLGLKKPELSQYSKQIIGKLREYQDVKKEIDREVLKLSPRERELIETSDIDGGELATLYGLKNKKLFDISENVTTIVGDLDNGRLSSDLESKFSERSIVFSPTNADVSTQSMNREWRLEVLQETQYLVELEDGKLDSSSIQTEAAYIVQVKSLDSEGNPKELSVFEEFSLNGKDSLEDVDFFIEQTGLSHKELNELLYLDLSNSEINSGLARLLFINNTGEAKDHISIEESTERYRGDISAKYLIDFEKNIVPENLKADLEVFGVKISDNVKILIDLLLVERIEKWVVRDLRNEQEGVLFSIYDNDPGKVLSIYEKQDDNLQKLFSLKKVDGQIKAFESDTERFTIDSADLIQQLESFQLPENIKVQLREEFSDNSITLPEVNDLILYKEKLFTIRERNNQFKVFEGDDERFDIADATLLEGLKASQLPENIAEQLRTIFSSAVPPIALSDDLNNIKIYREGVFVIQEDGGAQLNVFEGGIARFSITNSNLIEDLRDPRLLNDLEERIRIEEQIRNVFKNNSINFSGKIRLENWKVDKWRIWDSEKDTTYFARHDGEQLVISEEPYDRLTNLTIRRLDRIYRFLKLSRKLKWSFADLDWAIRSLQGTDIGEKVLRFDGVNDFVDIPNVPKETEAFADSQNAFTLEAWVNPALTGINPVFSKGNPDGSALQFLFWVTPSGKLALTTHLDQADLGGETLQQVDPDNARFRSNPIWDGQNPLWYDSREGELAAIELQELPFHDLDGEQSGLTLISDRPIPLGTFSHIAISVNEKTTIDSKDLFQLKFYINGVLDSTWSLAKPLPVTEIPEGVERIDINIGKNLLNEFFSGDITDVRLWGGIVPETEIAKHRFQRCHAREIRKIYDLNLMSLNNTDALPQKGRSLMIVAKIGDFYHARIFDVDGQILVDKQLQPDTTLKQELDQAFANSVIGGQTERELMRKITSSLGHTQNNIHLVAYWPLVESQDLQVRDLAIFNALGQKKSEQYGQHYDGILGGSNHHSIPLWVDGDIALDPLPAAVSSHAYHFNGIDGYISGTVKNLELSTLTLEAWIKIDESGTYPIITQGTVQTITQDNGTQTQQIEPKYKLWLEPDATDPSGTTSKLVFWHSDLNKKYTSAQTISVGELTHVAAVVTGKTERPIRLYINAEPEKGKPSPELGETYAPPLISPNSGATASLQDASLLYLGRDFSTNYLQGTLQEVRIWGTARSQKELEKARHYQLVGSEPDLAGYWRLDEPDPDRPDAKVDDRSFNENHLYLGGLPSLYQPTLIKHGEAILPNPVETESPALRFDAGQTPAIIQNQKRQGLGHTEQFTLEFWFKAEEPDILKQKQVLLSQGDGKTGLNIYVFEGRVIAYAWQANLDKSIAHEIQLEYPSNEIELPIDTAWHHITFTYDETSEKGEESRLEDQPNATFSALDRKQLPSEEVAEALSFPGEVPEEEISFPVSEEQVIRAGFEILVDNPTREWRIRNYSNNVTFLLRRNGQELSIYKKTPEKDEIAYKFYLDGVLVDSNLDGFRLDQVGDIYLGNCQPNTQPDAFTRFHTGEPDSGESLHFKGLITDFRLWSTAWSQTAITQPNHAKHPRHIPPESTKNLLCYFPMTEGYGRNVSDHSGPLFDEDNQGPGPTIIPDQSPNQHHGQLSVGLDTPTWQYDITDLPVFRDTVLQLNGIDQYLHLPCAAELNLIKQSFTVEVWIKVSAFNSGMPILSTRQPDDGDDSTPAVCSLPLSLHLTETGQVQANLGEHRVTTTNSLTLDKWHYIAWRFQKGTDEQQPSIQSLVVIDGEPDLSPERECPVPTPTPNPIQSEVSIQGLEQDIDLYLGYSREQHQSTTLDHFFSGNIAELRIWNTARTDAEIQQNWNLQIQDNPENLAAYWVFDQDPRSVLLDRTSHFHRAVFELVAETNLDDKWEETAAAFKRQALALNLNPDPKAPIDFIDLNTYEITEKGTIELWVQFCHDRSQILLDASSPGDYCPFRIEVRASKLRFSMADQSGNVLCAQIDLNQVTPDFDSQFHHLAATWDRTKHQTQLFLDDIHKVQAIGRNHNQQVQATGGNHNQLVITPNFQTPYIGLKRNVKLLNFSNEVTGAFPFRGEISQLRIWDHVRTRQELQQLRYTDLESINTGEQNKAGDDDEPSSVLEKGLVTYLPIVLEKPDTLIDCATGCDVPIRRIAVPYSNPQWNVVDYYIDLDGQDDFIHLEHYCPTESGTIELWAKFRAGRNQILFDASNDEPQGAPLKQKFFLLEVFDCKLQFKLEDKNDLNFVVTLELDEATLTTFDQQWHHIVATWRYDFRYNAVTARLYLDDQFAETSKPAHTPLAIKKYLQDFISPTLRGGGLPGFETLFIGQLRGAYYPDNPRDRTNNFDGQIRRIRIWEDIRTQQELQEFRNVDSPTSLSGLLVNLLINEGEGDSLRNCLQGNSEEQTARLIVSDDYDLQLISLNQLDDLPTKGKNTVTIAKIGESYHVRIFDIHGNQEMIPEGNSELSPSDELAARLESAFNDQSLDRNTKNELIQEIASSLGHTLGKTLEINSKWNLFDYAIELNGIDTFIDLYDYKPELEGSIELWVQFSRDRDQILFDASSDQNIFTLEVVDGILCYRLNDDTGAHISLNYSSVSFDRGWHHVVVTWHKYAKNYLVATQLFVDDQLHTTIQSASDEHWAALSNLYIGRPQKPIGGGYAFQGQVRQLRVWNCALSQEQVKNLRYTQQISYENDLLIDLPIDEAKGNCLRNRTQGNDAIFKQGIAPNPAWVHNKARLFRFEQDYLVLPQTSTLELIKQDFTIEATFCLQDLAEERPILGIRGPRDTSQTNAQFTISVNTAGHVRAQFQGRELEADRLVLQANRWYQVICQYCLKEQKLKLFVAQRPSITYEYDPDRQRLVIRVYRNYTLDCYELSEIDAYGIDRRLYVGYNRYWDTDQSAWRQQFFHGFIDEIRFWQGTRSPEEILEHHDRRLRGDESNLVACWSTTDNYHCTIFAQGASPHRTLIPDQVTSIENLFALERPKIFRSRYAPSLDGYNDYIDLHQTFLESTQSRTIECWFKTHRNWQHLAVAYHDSVQVFYLNGEAVAMPSPALQQVIRAWVSDQTTPPTPDTFFDGEIAELRLWQSERTAAQIEANFNRSLTGREPDLWAYWPLNGGKDVALIDISETLTSATYETGLENTADKWHKLPSSSSGYLFDSDAVSALYFDGKDDHIKLLKRQKDDVESTDNKIKPANVADLKLDQSAYDWALENFVFRLRFKPQTTKILWLLVVLYRAQVGRSFTVETWVKLDLTSANKCLPILGVPCPNKNQPNTGEGQPNTSEEQCNIGEEQDNLCLGIKNNRPYCSLGKPSNGKQYNLHPEGELDDGWHHIAWQYDAFLQTMRILVDGQSVARRDGLLPAVANAEVTIGHGQYWEKKDKEFKAGYFQGWIAEIRIWQTALQNEAIRYYWQRPLPGSQAVLQDLIAYWIFDDRNRTLIPSRVPNHHENSYQLILESDPSHAQPTWTEDNITDHPVWVNPLPKTALQFDGDTQYLATDEFQFQLSNSNQFTLEAWVKVDDFNAPRPIFWWRNLAENLTNFELRIDGNGNIQFYTQEATPLVATDDSPIVSGEFAHIAIVTEPATTETRVTLFVNGEAKQSDTTAETLIEGSQLLQIGRSDRDATPQYFKGLIQEVRIWDGQPQTVSAPAHRYEPLASDEPLERLLAYWPLTQIEDVEGELYTPNAVPTQPNESTAPPPLRLGGFVSSRKPAVGGDISFLDARHKVLTFPLSLETLNILPIPSFNVQRNEHRSQRTIEVWFQCEDPFPARKQILYEEGDCDRNLSIYIQRGYLHFEGVNRPEQESGWTSPSHISTVRVQPGHWHHAALVLDGRGEVHDNVLCALLDGRVIDTQPGSQLWGQAQSFSVGGLRLVSSAYEPLTLAANQYSRQIGTWSKNKTVILKVEPTDTDENNDNEHPAALEYLHRVARSSYQVYLRYPTFQKEDQKENSQATQKANSTRNCWATNVPIEITHTKGTYRTCINQNLWGGVWQSLGQFELIPNNSTVRISNQGADGPVVVGQLKFVRVDDAGKAISSVPPIEISADHYSDIKGPWVPISDVVWQASKTARAETGKPSTLDFVYKGATGQYQILLRYPLHPNDSITLPYASNVPVKISHREGTTHLKVNQHTLNPILHRPTGNQWQEVDLGCYELESGESHIHISNKDVDGQVVVGELRFIHQQSVDPHYQLQGQLKEVRVWEGARSLEQLQQNRFELPKDDRKGLLFYWQIEQSEEPDQVLPEQALSNMKLPEVMTSRHSEPTLPLMELASAHRLISSENQLSLNELSTLWANLKHTGMGDNRTLFDDIFNTGNVASSQRWFYVMRLRWEADPQPNNQNGTAIVTNSGTTTQGSIRARLRGALGGTSSEDLDLMLTVLSGEDFSTIILDGHYLSQLYRLKTLASLLKLSMQDLIKLYQRLSKEYQAAEMPFGEIEKLSVADVMQLKQRANWMRETGIDISTYNYLIYDEPLDSSDARRFTNATVADLATDLINQAQEDLLTPISFITEEIPELASRTIYKQLIAREEISPIQLALPVEVTNAEGEESSQQNNLTETSVVNPKSTGENAVDFVRSPNAYLQLIGEKANWLTAYAGVSVSTEVLLRKASRLNSQPIDKDDFDFVGALQKADKENSGRAHPLISLPEDILEALDQQLISGMLKEQKNGLASPLSVSGSEWILSGQTEDEPAYVIQRIGEGLNFYEILNQPLGTLTQENISGEANGNDLKKRKDTSIQELIEQLKQGKVPDLIRKKLMLTAESTPEVQKTNQGWKIQDTQSDKAFAIEAVEIGSGQSQLNFFKIYQPEIDNIIQIPSTVSEALLSFDPVFESQLNSNRIPESLKAILKFRLDPQGENGIFNEKYTVITAQWLISDAESIHGLALKASEKELHFYATSDLSEKRGDIALDSTLRKQLDAGQISQELRNQIQEKIPEFSFSSSQVQATRIAWCLKNKEKCVYSIEKKESKSQQSTLYVVDLLDRELKAKDGEERAPLEINLALATQLDQFFLQQLDDKTGKAKLTESCNLPTNLRALFSYSDEDKEPIPLPRQIRLTTVEWQLTTENKRFTYTIRQNSELAQPESQITNKQTFDVFVGWIDNFGLVTIQQPAQLTLNQLKQAYGRTELGRLPEPEESKLFEVRDLLLKNKEAQAEILPSIQRTLDAQRTGLQTSIDEKLADILGTDAELLRKIISTDKAGGITYGNGQINAPVFLQQLNHIQQATNRDKALDAAPDLYGDLQRLSKILFLLRQFELSEVERNILLSQPSTFGLSETSLIQPSLADLTRLHKFTELKTELNDPGEVLVRILSNAEPNAQEIKDLTGWSIPEQYRLAQALNLPLNQNSILDLAQLRQAFHLIQKLGSNAKYLLDLSDFKKVKTFGSENVLRESSFDFYQRHAEILLNLAQAKCSDEQWTRAYKPLHDRVATQKRDALTAVAMEKYEGQLTGRKSPDVLYEYLLIDVQIGSEVDTSPIVQGIASLQLYVQRCLMNLERGVKLEQLLDKEWLLMKNYRVWEANRKVFLYPENYIEPELRDTKTPIFRQLEEELLQGDINQETAEVAYTHYLDRFKEISNLNIVGSYLDRARIQPTLFALDFNGKSSIDLGTVSGAKKFIPQDFTIELWLNKTESQFKDESIDLLLESVISVAGGNSLFPSPDDNPEEGEGWILSLWPLDSQEEGYLVVFLLNTTSETIGVSSSEPSNQLILNFGRWHHIAVTLNNSKLILYIDGELISQRPVSGQTKYPENGEIKLGGFQFQGPNPDVRTGIDFFAGQMRELRIWNTALTQDEIRKTRFTKDSSLFKSSSLIRHWRMDAKTDGYLQNIAVLDSEDDGIELKDTLTFDENIKFSETLETEFISTIDATKNNVLYLVGRNELTQEYYFRRLVNSFEWEPWQKIDISINAKFVSPVFAFNKLFIFWSELQESVKTEDRRWVNNDSEGRPIDQLGNEIVLENKPGENGQNEYSLPRNSPEEKVKTLEGVRDNKEQGGIIIEDIDGNFIFETRNGVIEQVNIPQRKPILKYSYYNFSKTWTQPQTYEEFDDINDWQKLQPKWQRVYAHRWRNPSFPEKTKISFEKNAKVTQLTPELSISEAIKSSDMDKLTFSFWIRIENIKDKSSSSDSPNENHLSFFNYTQQNVSELTAILSSQWFSIGEKPEAFIALRSAYATFNDIKSVRLSIANFREVGTEPNRDDLRSKLALVDSSQDGSNLKTTIDAVEDLTNSTKEKDFSNKIIDAASISKEILEKSIPSGSLPFPELSDDIALELANLFRDLAETILEAAQAIVSETTEIDETEIKQIRDAVAEAETNSDGANNQIDLIINNYFPSFLRPIEDTISSFIDARDAEDKWERGQVELKLQAGEDATGEDTAVTLTSLENSSWLHVALTFEFDEPQKQYNINQYIYDRSTGEYLGEGRRQQISLKVDSKLSEQGNIVIGSLNQSPNDLADSQYTVFISDFRAWSLIREEQSIRNERDKRLVPENPNLTYFRLDQGQAVESELVFIRSFEDLSVQQSSEERILLVYGGRFFTLKSNLKDIAYLYELEANERDDNLSFDLRISSIGGGFVDSIKTDKFLPEIHFQDGRRDKKGYSLDRYYPNDRFEVLYEEKRPPTSPPTEVKEAEGTWRNPKLEPSDIRLLRNAQRSNADQLDITKSYILDVHNQPGWKILDIGDEVFLIKINIGDFLLKTTEERLTVESYRTLSEGEARRIGLYYARDYVLEGKYGINPNFEFIRLNTFAIQKLSEALFREGIEGLLSYKMQELEEPSFDELLEDRNLAETRRIIAPKYKPNSFQIDNQLDFEGAYGLYYWEVFFHIPFLIANQLNSNQKFSEAQKWYHYIFNPTAQSTTGIEDSSANDNYWQFRPFRNLSLESLSEMLSNESALEKYRKDPLDPHAIARLRVNAYQKAVVMKYIDNLLDWGDHLFRQDTRESINEALNLYVLAFNLLGMRPKAKPKRELEEIGTYQDVLNDLKQSTVDLPESFPDFMVGTNNPRSSSNRSSQLPFTSNYNVITRFLVPENTLFLGYWDRVEDRLFKIRHSLNIDGVFRSLDLFQPPIDPAILVRAVAGGGLAAGLSAALGTANLQVPHYRYSVILEKAKEILRHVIELGGALLQALEKKDAEDLTILLNTHELNLLNRTTEIKELQKAEAEANLKSLEVSLKSVKDRQGHYQNLIDQGINQNEIDNMSYLGKASDQRYEAAIIRSTASFLRSLPDLQIGGAGAFGSPYVTGSIGGSILSAVIELSATSQEVAADITSTRSQITSILAGFERRAEDWELQEKIASHEISQIEHQIEASAAQINITTREIQIHEQTIDQQKEVGEFYRQKFSNKDLYSWMSSRLSGLYFQTYKLAFDLAKQAEKAFQFEYATNDTFINFGYWDSRRKGLMAGEALRLDLARLEKASLDRNKRHLEITKHISLAQLDPFALLQFKETGRCQFSLSELLFDRDYPGHYCRMIKTLSISIPAIVGPYQTFKATLTQTGNKTLLTPDIGGVRYLLGEEQDTPPVIRADYRSNQQIAISTGVEDSGMFELNFGDSRYLPFEGTGAVSNWLLEMPKATNSIDFNAITDVIIHLRYTCKSDGGLFKQQVMELEAFKTYQGVRLLSLAHDAPSEWQTFISDKSKTIKVPITENTFPPNVDVDLNVDPVNIQQIYNLDKDNTLTEATSLFNIAFDPQDDSPTFTLTPTNRFDRDKSKTLLVFISFTGQIALEN